MAVLHAEVFSESLMRKVPLTCLIPADKCDYANLANEKPTRNPIAHCISYMVLLAAKRII